MGLLDKLIKWVDKKRPPVSPRPWWVDGVRPDDIIDRPEPKRQGARPPGGDQRQVVAARSEDWVPGQILLEDFVVERLLGEGGMGKVYLVKSQTTNMRFAVKRTKGLSDDQRRNFLAELQTWIDLPEHPNLVPCRFFRTVEDEVLIFAEYVEGGSLKNWIDSRKLYEGGKEKALERILDTIIQFAWGLHCVHELGLVHQDVKPANVMIEKDAQVAVHANFGEVEAAAREEPKKKMQARWENGKLVVEPQPEPSPGGLKARVTDYGLARARVASGERYVPELDMSILVSSGGYTPAYCSPEQAGGRKLDRSTDMWSWGVSVMEMFRGGVAWQSGTVAAEALQAFLEHNGEEEHIPAMPDGVAELLNGCFREDPAQRWKSMEAVVKQLRGVYRAAVGAEYGRVLTKIERGSSQLGVGERRTPEGGSWKDPLDWLEYALLMEGRDPADAANMAARHAGSRRGRLVADVAVYDEARRILERLVRAGRKDLESDLSCLCSQAALVHETIGDSPGALALYDQAIGIRERLLDVKDPRKLASLATYYMNKGTMLYRLGERRAAMDVYDRAIEIREQLVRIDGRHEFAGSLAMLYSNKALAMHSLGDNATALTLYDQAIAILEQLVNVECQRSLSAQLATTYSNKALVVRGSAAAIELHTRAIEIFEQLVNVDGQRQFADRLATLYSNKASAVANSSQRDYRAAAELSGRAIEIFERLVNCEGRHELANELAGAYMNKALALDFLENKGAAVALYGNAIEIRERLVNVEARHELANDLATLYANKASAVADLGRGDNRAAVELYDRAIAIRERLVNVEGRRELAQSLEMLYLWKDMAVHDLERAALWESRKSVEPSAT